MRRDWRRDPAAEFGPDDGGDPKAFHDRRRRVPRPARGPGRKALQLCGQVRDAVQTILGGCADEALQALTVVSVEPAPHSGRLMVTVAVPRPADATDRSAAAEAMTRAGGLIRRTVAAAVHRRYAPELAFRVV
jgi:ribosome-binding factor A